MFLNIFAEKAQGSDGGYEWGEVVGVMGLMSFMDFAW